MELWLRPSILKKGIMNKMRQRCRLRTLRIDTAYRDAPRTRSSLRAYWRVLTEKTTHYSRPEDRSQRIRLLSGSWRTIVTVSKRSWLFMSRIKYWWTRLDCLIKPVCTTVWQPCQFIRIVDSHRGITRSLSSSLPRRRGEEKMGSRSTKAQSFPQDSM